LCAFLNEDDLGVFISDIGKRQKK